MATNQLNQSRTSSHYSQKNNNHTNPRTNNNYQSSFRLDPIQIQNQIRSLQDEIQFTISNYESILQTQKKNTAQRNQFLLYLIQTMKQKQNQQLLHYQSQLQSILQQKEQTSSLQSQMKNIGEGVDSILEEGKKLKEINESLIKELQDQTAKQKQLDQDIQSHNVQIDQLRRRVQQEQILKMKWNIKRKDLLGMIDQTEKKLMLNQKLCQETGIEEQNCQHCENNKMKKLMNKYQQKGSANNK